VEWSERDVILHAYRHLPDATEEYYERGPCPGKRFETENLRIPSNSPINSLTTLDFNVLSNNIRFQHLLLYSE
jgi:hypothetical protein